MHGAAAVSGSTPREIAVALASIMDADQRGTMAAAARRMSRPNGAKAAADAIRRLVSN
jgi:hypothetical protein